MFTQAPNQPYYKIKLSEIDEEVIGLLRFEGEEQISGLFEYRIEIVSSMKDLDSSKILNKPAVLTFIRGDKDSENIHGIISAFEQYGRAEEYTFYKLVLVPRLWRLKLIYQNEIYQNMEIDEIIEEVLSDAGLKGSSLKIDLKNQYPKREYIVQYRETNLNFLNRRLEHYGIYYYFDHSKDSDVVVFTDANSKLPNIHAEEEIIYNENKDIFGDTESIIDLTSKEKIVTGAVQLKDYNYMFPEKELIGESQIDSKLPGKYYDFGENFENKNDGEFLAKIRNQEFLSKSKIFKGLSDNRLLRAGHRFKLKLHFRDDWNSEYVLTKVSIKGSQQGTFGNLISQEEPEETFICRFTAIPYNIEFRPQRKTPIPRIQGIMSAKIESGSGDEYAFIDDHGRYKAKMLFDLSDKTNGEATLPIRLTQNYSGAGYGTHFPNHAGTELLFACVDGDPDRPVGLGTIPNPSQAAPVNSKNKTQNVIRTASGNEFVMEDKSKETQIYLNTPDSNKILLDDKDDKIEIITKDKHILTMDDKNQNIVIKSKEGHTILMDDQNTRIQILSKNGHNIIIDDSSGGEKIQLSDKDSKNHFVIDITNNKLLIETKEGSIDILAPQGEIKIKSKKLEIETDEDTSIKAMNVKAEAAQDFIIKASNLSEEASMDLKQKGMNVTSEASMDHKSKGLNISVEAGVNTEVKGTMVTVQSTGPNTIKGMPVQIN